MSDETKASILVIAWIVISFLCLSTGTKAGAIAAAFLTAILILIIYSSWLIERTEKRLRRYMSHADEEIRKGCEDNSTGEGF